MNWYSNAKVPHWPISTIQRQCQEECGEPPFWARRMQYIREPPERQCNLLNVLRCSRPLPSPTFSWAVTFVGVVWFELSSKCAKTLFSSLSSICKNAGVHVKIVASPLSPLIHLFREASRITLFRAGEHSSFVVKQDALSSLCRDNGLLAIEYCHAIA